MCYQDKGRVCSDMISNKIGLRSNRPQSNRPQVKRPQNESQIGHIFQIE
jgi:hypothetical protein